MAQETNTPSETESRSLLTGKRRQLLVAAVIAIYSITTATVAFTTTRASGRANAAEIAALGLINDANSFFEEGLLTLLRDFDLFDQMAVGENEGMSEASLDYLNDQLSEEALDALDRSGGVDGEYYDAIYAAYDRVTQEVDAAFVVNSLWGARATTNQILLLVMAIGLSLLGWASIMDRSSLTSRLFVVVSIITLLASLSVLTFRQFTQEDIPNSVNDIEDIETFLLDYYGEDYFE